MSEGPFITFRGQPDGPWMQSNGREARTLLQLITKGEKGFVVRGTPATGWSEDVFKLRAKGVRIETFFEHHFEAGGPCVHARYVLRGTIEFRPIERAGRADAQ